jgi:hypothetical protein
MLVSCVNATRSFDGLPGIARSLSVSVASVVQRRRRKAPFLKELGGQGHGKPFLSRRTSTAGQRRKEEASWKLKVMTPKKDRYRVLPDDEVFRRVIAGCSLSCGNTGGKSSE